MTITNIILLTIIAILTLIILIQHSIINEMNEKELSMESRLYYANQEKEKWERLWAEQLHETVEMMTYKTKEARGKDGRRS